MFSARVLLLRDIQTRKYLPQNLCLTVNYLPLSLRERNQAISQKATISCIAS